MDINDVRNAIQQKELTRRTKPRPGVRFTAESNPGPYPGQEGSKLAELLYNTVKGVGMLSKSYIQGFDPCNVGLEDLQLFVVQLKPLAESPDLNFEWLQEKFTAATAELNMRQRDEDRRRLKELEMEEDALRSREEKRAKLIAERQKLQEKLGVK